MAQYSLNFKTIKSQDLLYGDSAFFTVQTIDHKKKEISLINSCNQHIKTSFQTVKHLKKYKGNKNEH